MVQSLGMSAAQSSLSDLLRSLGDSAAADESDSYVPYGEFVAALIVAETALSQDKTLSKAPSDALATVMEVARDYGDTDTAKEVSDELRRRGVEVEPV
jgi:hypothetical protein